MLVGRGGIKSVALRTGLPLVAGNLKRAVKQQSIDGVHDICKMDGVEIELGRKPDFRYPVSLLIDKEHLINSGLLLARAIDLKILSCINRERIRKFLVYDLTLILL